MQKDEEDLAAAAEAEADVAMAATPAVQPANESDVEQLEAMLAQMAVMKFAESMMAPVRAKLAMAKTLAPKVALESSITLRTALKQTRDLHEKANSADEKAIEAAEEAVKKAQEHLTAVRTKKEERLDTFKQEESKLLAALQKAEEAEKAEGGYQGQTKPVPAAPTHLHGQVTETDVLDRVVLMAQTAEGRAVLAIRGLSVMAAGKSPNRRKASIPHLQGARTPPRCRSNDLSHPFHRICIRLWLIALFSPESQMVAVAYREQPQEHLRRERSTQAAEAPGARQQHRQQLQQKPRQDQSEK